MIVQATARGRGEGFRERYGPVALVTGASDGVGREFARVLAARGLDLIVVARRRERLDSLAEEIRAAHGVRVEVLAADLARPDDVARVVAASGETDVGLLVAAAGFGSIGPLLDLPEASETEMIDVNCRAVLSLVHAIGRRLRERRRGGVVLMSSIVAFQGAPLSANYAATKAFVQSLAEGLCAELKPFGVDVIASAPGPIASGFAARAGMKMGLSQPPAAVAAETLDALGRSGTVRPGWLAKALGYALSTLPRRARVAAMARIMKGMETGGPAPGAARTSAGA